MEKMKKKALIIRMEEIYVMELQKEFFVTYTENRLGTISTTKNNYKECIIQTIMNLYVESEHHSVIIYYSQSSLNNVIHKVQQIVENTIDPEMKKKLEEKGKAISNLVNFKFEANLIPISDYFKYFNRVNFSSEARKNDYWEVKTFIFQEMVLIITDPNFPLYFLKTY